MTLRFSLTTFFSVSLLAALFLWLNVRERETSGYFDWLEIAAPNGSVLAWTECAGRGFPATFQARLRYQGGNRDFFDWDTLILNVLFCGLVLFLTALIIERSVRRHTGGRGRANAAGVKAALDALCSLFS